MKKLILLSACIQLLCVVLCAQPGNNLPCGAITIVLATQNEFGEACTPTTTYTWVGATDKGFVADGVICSQYGSAKTVWYKFTIPASGSFTINTAPVSGDVTGTFLGGYQLALFNAEKCNASAYSYYCSEYFGDGKSINYPTVTMRDQTPGAVHYMALFRQGGLPDGSLKLCISGIPKIAPTNERVGVGITAPRKNLDVNGNMHVQGDISILGKVGIGTTNPQFPFDITGRIRIKANTVNGIESPGIWLNKMDNSAGTVFLGMANDTTVGFYGNYGSDWNGFVMNSKSGFVGIGNQTPLFPLSLASTVGDKISLYGSQGAHYGFGIQGGLLQIHTDAANGNIGFGYGSSGNFTERMRIMNSGTDGMTLNGRLILRNGTNNPDNSPGVWLLNPSNTELLGFMGTASSTNVGFYGGPANWGFVYNVPTGNVGIGNTNPLNPLSFPPALGKKISLYPGGTGDVGIGVYASELRLYNDVPGGKISFGIDDYNNGFTELGKFQRNGDYAMSVFGSIWANGTTYVSDERFKKNIEPLEQSLEKILQLKGVSYEMRADEFTNMHFGKGQQVGLVAQEVEKVIPEVVSTGPDGYKAIDYAKLVPLLIEAIKTQEENNKQTNILMQQQIDALKKIIADIKSK